ncbi:hypothetical protein ABC974_25925 [Sphingomonas oligophenolica]|uniref:Uncharacterized protein n=1 Tax=Sphingomonas oligophenolica TaxID=301154 RepID=A0ABU9YBA0_9SPHN
MTDRRQQAEGYARAAQASRNKGNFYDALLQQRRAVALLRDVGEPRRLPMPSGMSPTSWSMQTAPGRRPSRSPRC